ncbi:SRPBCC family protein [uncultured Cytophaga sp.]|uniref:SRPBCC family protein n=1 Tax=uncultured Cytophaga sp. TaxID=160238 RepID=UPI002624C908|nr:SRPBCC family protein [uncultured Cytophaga sp.]
MKILKVITVIVGVFVALFLLVAAIMPSTYTVSVSTVINKPQKEVYDFVKSLKNQEYYSVWVMKDSNLVMTYTGVDGTLGFVAHWSSSNDQVGEGEQKITKVDGERVEVDIRFERPFEGEQKAATIVKDIGENKTKVISEFYGHDSYPWNALSFVGKSIIKDAQTQNMVNLKVILER